MAIDNQCLRSLKLNVYPISVRIKDQQAKEEPSYRCRGELGSLDRSRASRGAAMSRL
jgi:hypothetical protein